MWGGRSENALFEAACSGHMGMEPLITPFSALAKPAEHVGFR